MKKILFGSLVVLLTLTLRAQSGPGVDGTLKPPPANRWKHDSIKLQLYVTLNPAQIGDVKTAFLSFYNDMDALMQQAKTAPPPKEELEKIHAKRSTALQAIFSTQQFDRFQTFEREFMPPPPHSPKNSLNNFPPEKV